MSDETRKVVRISAETEALIKKYADKRGMGVGEAADQLIATGFSRLETLARYGKNQKKADKPKRAKKAKANGAAAHA